MFAISSVGGAVIPWVVGLVSAKAGGLRQGMLVPLSCMLAMLSLYVWGMRPRSGTSIVQPL
jgi:fucose permease